MNIIFTSDHFFIIDGTFINHTPRLRYLSFDLSNIHDGEELQIPISSITELNLSFVGSQSNIIENLLQHMPNLCQLKIVMLK